MEVLELIFRNFIINAHSMLSMEGQWFYAWFGFIFCIVMVLASKLLGVIVKRKTDYYKDEDDE